MKTYKIHYALLSILLFMASCVDDKMDGSPNETYSFTAQIEQDNSTRTTVNAQNQVLWTNGDEIGIYGDHQTKNALFSLQTSNGTSAQFSGELKSGEQPEFAYYPYQQGTELNGNSLTFELPNEYIYTGNSNAPMIGFSDGKQSLSFKHLCGLMKVTVRDVPEESVRFVITSAGESPQPIAGTAAVDDVYAPNATLSIKESGDKAYTITYQLSGSVTAQEFTFFIPLPVGEYDKLTVSLRSAEDEVLYQKSTSDVRIKRACILSMPTLSGDEDISYVLTENTVQLSPDDELYIQSATAVDETSDQYTITYYSDTPEEKIPQVGQVVLYNEVTEKFPSGFLGKVIGVEKTNGGYEILTEPAGLDDAFEKLDMHQTFDLVPAESYMPQTRLDIEHDENGFLVFKKGIDVQEGILKADGSISLGLKLAVDIVKDNWLSVSYASFTLYSSFQAGFGFSIQAASAEKKHSFKLFKIPIKASPSAIIISPDVVLEAILKAEGNADMNFEVEYDTGIMEGGFIYDNGIWEKGKNSSNTEKKGKATFGLSEAQLKMEGSIFGGVGTALEIKLFNNKNIKARIGLEAGPQMTGNVTCDLTALGDGIYNQLKDTEISWGININVNAEAEASLFKNHQDWKEPINIEIFDKTFFEKSYFLFPAFENEKVEVDKGNKAALVQYDTKRNLLFKSGIGIELYKGEELVERSPQKNYQKEAEFTNPLWHPFGNLEEGTNYTARPYVAWGEHIFSASPEQKFEIKEDEDDEPDVDPTGGMLSEFYYSAYGDNWINNDGWLKDENLQNWYGVSETWKYEWEDTTYWRLDLNGNNLTGNPVLRNSNIIRSMYLLDNPIHSITLNNCQELRELYLPGRGENITINSCHNSTDTHSGNYYYGDDVEIYPEEGLIGNVTVTNSRYRNFDLGESTSVGKLEFKDLDGSEQEQRSSISAGDIKELNFDNFIGGRFNIDVDEINTVNISNFTMGENLGSSDYNFFHLDAYVDTINISQSRDCPWLEILHNVGVVNIGNIYSDYMIPITFHEDVQEVNIYNVHIRELNIHQVNLDAQNVYNVSNSELGIAGACDYTTGNGWSDKDYEMQHNSIFNLKNCMLRCHIEHEAGGSSSTFINIDSFRGTIPEIRQYLESHPEFQREIDW